MRMPSRLMQLDRLTGQHADRLVEILQIAGIDHSQRQSAERTVRGVDPHGDDRMIHLPLTRPSPGTLM